MYHKQHLGKMLFIPDTMKTLQINSNWIMPPTKPPTASNQINQELVNCVKD